MRFLYRTRGPGNVREGMRGREYNVRTREIVSLHTNIYRERKEEKIILFLLVYVITEDAEIKYTPSPFHPPTYVHPMFPPLPRRPNVHFKIKSKYT
jgi:hypothetical protein